MKCFSVFVFFAIVPVLMIGSFPARAEIEMEFHPCSEKRLIKTRNATLPDLIQVLQKETGLGIAGEIPQISIPDIERRRTVADLLREIVSDLNLIAIYESDPNCAGGQVLSEIHFLNTGEKTPMMQLPVAQTLPDEFDGTRHNPSSARSVEKRLKDELKEEGRKPKKLMTPEERFNYEVEKRNKKKYGK